MKELNLSDGANNYFNDGQLYIYNNIYQLNKEYLKDKICYLSFELDINQRDVRIGGKKRTIRKKKRKTLRKKKRKTLRKKKKRKTLRK